MAELKSKPKALTEHELLKELEAAYEAIELAKSRLDKAIGYKVAVEQLLAKLQIPEKPEKEGGADSDIH